MGAIADRRREKRRQRRPFPHVTLAAALRKALATPTLRRRMSVLEIAGQWDDLVGEDAAQHVQPFSLDKGTLVLQTDSSVWRQQISLMRPEILEKVRERFSDLTFKQVKVK
jgi:predicted nucleic acid-binding Zn ribbon protein